MLTVSPQSTQRARRAIGFKNNKSPRPLRTLRSISFLFSQCRPLAATKCFRRPSCRGWSLTSSPLTRFATGNGPASSTAPMISNLCQAGANPASTGEVILWGYLDDLINLSRRGRGTQAMVATLKRPPPARRPRRIFTETSAFNALEAPPRIC